MLCDDNLLKLGHWVGSVHESGVTEACIISGVDHVVTDAEERERLFVAVIRSNNRRWRLRERRHVFDARMG